ncbi:MAG: efflux RND transporter periplasmic adaptor subunit [Victivallales bacterium]
MKNRRTILMLTSGLLVLALLLWLSGKFSSKISLDVPKLKGRDISGQVVPVRLVKMPLTESAVGTVQAVHEIAIASNFLGTSSFFLLGQITEVNVKAGQEVKRNDVLLKLDDTNPRTKLQQAKSSLEMAEAAYKQAVIDEKRMGTLVKSQAVSQGQYDLASTKLKSTEADLRRIQEVVTESQSILDYATIRSPIDGIVIDKKVNVGDTVSPGQTLLKLIDPTRMQMVASVRESLASRLKAGQSIGVKIDTLNKLCSGTISEIVPESSSTSRTFLVKVTGPCPAGIYSGMFGRILIPLEDEQVLLIPARALRMSGQLELVDVAENGQELRRSVRAGRTFGEDIEILSGLKEGEQVVVPAVPEDNSNAR